MKINYLGHSCFLVNAEDKNFLFDPFDSKMVGLPLKKQRADICLTSHGHADHNHIAVATGKTEIIDTPQNFTFGNVNITGFQSFHDDCEGLKRGKNIVFKLAFNGFSFVHMGDIGFVDYPLINKLRGIDAVAIPVGGNYTIDAKLAYEYIKEIKPRYVIPMHYLTTGVKIDISSPDEFLRNFDEEQIIRTDCLDTDSLIRSEKPLVYMLYNIMIK